MNRPETRRHPHLRARAIVSRDHIAANAFMREYVRRGRPVVLRQRARNWPATRNWSFAYFAQLSPDVHVYPEVGDVLHEPTRFDGQMFSDYVRRIDAGQRTDSYLAVFNLFKAFPSVRQDVDFSLLAHAMPINYLTSWIGPAHTVSGYHVDWSENLFAQIYGRKRFFLVAPEDSGYMYPGDKFDCSTTVSQIDARDYDPTQFPLFSRASVYTTELQPGDLLYIPRGWWHFARSLDASISVNNFAISRLGCIRDLPRSALLLWLHEHGLYGDHCRCHTWQDGRRVRSPCWHRNLRT